MYNRFFCIFILVTVLPVIHSMEYVGDFHICHDFLHPRSHTRISSDRHRNAGAGAALLLAVAVFESQALQRIALQENETVNPGQVRELL